MELGGREPTKTFPLQAADAGDYEPGADEGLSTGEWGPRKLVDGGE
jgi:hypothetical protein